MAVGRDEPLAKYTAVGTSKAQGKKEGGASEGDIPEVEGNLQRAVTLAEGIELQER